MDPIDKRLMRDRLNKTVIKYWNVRYVDGMEGEEDTKIGATEELSAEEAEAQEKAMEVFQRLQDEANADEMAKIAEQQEAYRAAAEAEEAQAAWMERTGASGVYGQKPVEDEDEKARIESILAERSNGFEDMLSGLTDNKVDT